MVSRWRDLFLYRLQECHADNAHRHPFFYPETGFFEPFCAFLFGREVNATEPGSQLRGDSDRLFGL